MYNLQNVPIGAVVAKLANADGTRGPDARCSGISTTEIVTSSGQVAKAESSEYGAEHRASKYSLILTLTQMQ